MTKRLFTGLLIIISFSSCQDILIGLETLGPVGALMNEQYDYEWDTLPEFENYYDINKWVTDNIYYEKDNPKGLKFDDWKSPAETVLDGYGDCEDFSILTAFLISKFLEEESTIILGQNKNADSRHVFIEYKGFYRQPVRQEFSIDTHNEYLKSIYTIIGEYSLSQALEIANNSLVRSTY